MDRQGSGSEEKSNTGSPPRKRPLQIPLRGTTLTKEPLSLERIPVSMGWRHVSMPWTVSPEPCSSGRSVAVRSCIDVAGSQDFQWLQENGVAGLHLEAMEWDSSDVTLVESAMRVVTWPEDEDVAEGLHVQDRKRFKEELLDTLRKLSVYNAELANLRVEEHAPGGRDPQVLRIFVEGLQTLARKSMQDMKGLMQDLHMMPWNRALDMALSKMSSQQEQIAINSFFNTTLPIALFRECSLHGTMCIIDVNEAFRDLFEFDSITEERMRAESFLQHKKLLSEDRAIVPHCNGLTFERLYPPLVAKALSAVRDFV